MLGFERLQMDLNFSERVSRTITGKKGSLGCTSAAADHQTSHISQSVRVLVQVLETSGSDDIYVTYTHTTK